MKIRSALTRFCFASLLGRTAAAMLSLLVLPSALQAQEIGKPQQLTNPDQTPEGLEKSDWASIRAAHTAWEHSFQPIEGGWQARNKGQQWTTRFDERGFVSQPQGAEWQWGLELRSYGFGESQHQVGGKPEMTADGQRLSYQWNANMQEWWINDQRGLEHGFILAQRPEGASAGSPLEVRLGTRGTLKANVAADAQTVYFRDAAGAPVVNYSGLKVWDADGQVLTSRFVAGTEGGIVLRVEESSARYPITIDPIAQQAYLKASQVSWYDSFGISVAVSGNTVVVGASQEASSTTGINSTPDELASAAGAAYVFVRSGTTWSQQAYLKASQVTANDYFGSSVAVSEDTVVVGAYGEDSSTTGINSTPNESATDAGAAYVFVRSGTTWSQQAYLKASQVSRYDSFGISVAVSGDTVVVGAPYEDSSTTGINSTPNESATDAGAAYVFVRNGTTWSQQAYLKASQVSASDQFGRSVAVSGDTVVVGAPYEASSTTGINSTPNELASSAGAAYVFVRSGTTWSQQAYLKTSQVTANDYFGWSVAVSVDTVVVGAPYEASSTTGINSTPNELASSAGAAYVFVRSGTTWSQQAYLKPSAESVGFALAGDYFGYSVAVSGDTVVVGALYEDSSTTGINSTPNESATDAGAAYVFVRSGTTWSQQAYLKASQVSRYDYFGTSVAVSGDTVFVGAPSEDSSTTGINSTPNELANGSGAAYLFTGLGSTNTAPQATAQSVTTAEDTAVSIMLAGTDADGNTLTYAVASGSAHGTLSGTAPNLTYTPAANYHGPDSFTFKVNDGFVDSAAATVSIVVKAPMVIEYVTVGNAGNAADPSTGYGAVAYKYQIGKYEVTNAQYAEFLNAKAATDSYSLYNPSMASYGITRSGSSGSYSYSVTGGLENRPVVYVSWFDAARMANWMMNGQGSGDTETGAYTLNGATSGVVLANAGAQVYIPTENEWYKAAYYNGATSTYSLYPNGQNTITTADANYENSVGSSTNVGTYSSDPSFYGTFDQGGNVWERNDTVNYGSNYVLRGGCWLASTGSGVFQLASSFRFNYGPTVEAFIFGFRLASKQVNIAPMADAQTVSVNEDSTLAITLTGSDVDGSSLTYAVGTPSHGTLSGTAPNLTYTPAANYQGPDSFTFKVNDGVADSAAATISITVNSVNDAPVATAQTVSVNEDSTLSITLTGSDVDGSSLTYAVGTPSHGSLTGTAPNLTYTPAANYHGPDSFTFTVNDGTVDSAAATVSITVNPVNDAPMAAAQTVSVNEDSTLSITLTGSDVEGSSLTYTVGTPSHGTLTGSAPNLTYTPAASYNGPDSFTFTANDGVANSVAATISITVNAAPVANAQTVSVNEDGTLSITLTGSDVEGSSLTYAVGTPSHGTLTGTAPNLTYTPDLDYNGLDSFTFTVNDGAAGSAAATVSITVTPVTDLEYVTIGNAGNPADPTSGHGAVSRAYKIGKYEVTHAQYAEFLNRKASDTDVHELYSPSASDYGITVYGITRSGIPGNYTYSVESGMENRPIVLVTWFNAARFCNWLANGKGDGDTETGSYTLNGAMEGIINANPEAEVWIPTEDQWYKAAYYQGNGSYSIYPNGQNTMTAAEANCIDETGTYLQQTTEVGAYAASPSHYGAFDLGGNVAEWIDGFEFMFTSEETGVSVDIFGRVYRGGSLGYEYYYMESRVRDLIPPRYSDNEQGFRVASMAELFSPTLTDPSAANMTARSSTLGGAVADDGGDVITERGVVYALTATNANPEIGGNGVIKVAATGTIGAFTVEITGLLGITNYSFKAYAINAQGTSYTPVGTFDTLVSTPIETWRNQYFGSTANTGAGADSASAGDGIVNLLKYALGIIPGENAAGGLPKAKLVNNDSNHYLALAFKRDPARNDVTIVVQAGSDLSGWTEVARCASGGSFTGLATVTETQNLDGTLNVEVSDVQAVAGAPRRFMRVLVERPE